MVLNNPHYSQLSLSCSICHSRSIPLAFIDIAWYLPQTALNTKNTKMTKVTLGSLTNGMMDMWTHNYKKMYIWTRGMYKVDTLLTKNYNYFEKSGNCLNYILNSPKRTNMKIINKNNNIPQYLQFLDFFNSLINNFKWEKKVHRKL